MQITSIVYNSIIIADYFASHLSLWFQMNDLVVEVHSNYLNHCIT